MGAEVLSNRKYVENVDDAGNELDEPDGFDKTSITRGEAKRSCIIPFRVSTLFRADFMKFFCNKCSRMYFL